MGENIFKNKYRCGVRVCALLEEKERYTIYCIFQRGSTLRMHYFHHFYLRGGIRLKKRGGMEGERERGRVISPYPL